MSECLPQSVGGFKVSLVDCKSVTNNNYTVVIDKSAAYVVSVIDLLYWEQQHVAGIYAATIVNGALTTLQNVYGMFTASVDGAGNLSISKSGGNGDTLAVVLWKIV